MSIIGQALDAAPSQKEYIILFTLLPFLLILPFLLYYYIKSTYHRYCKKSKPSVIFENRNLLAKYCQTHTLLHPEIMSRSRKGSKKENHIEGVCFCEKITGIEVEGKKQKKGRKKNPFRKWDSPKRL